jgi:subtilase family serine protease
MRRPTFTIATGVALVTAVSLVGPPAAYASDDPTVPGSHPAWATAQNRIAEAPAGTRLSFRVYLKMRDQAGAEAAAAAVATPGSAAYRRYLSPEQVRQRFAPAAASVSAVRSWLTGGGFAIGEVPDNNLYVEASGTVAQAEKAFGVDLATYRVGGQALRAADHDPRVPAAMGALVSGVVGLGQTATKRRPDRRGAADEMTVPPSDGFRNAPPCSDYWAQKLDRTDPPVPGQASPLPYAPCGYKPGQLRSAYGLDGRFDGRGSTVAIIDAFGSPTIYQDAAEYARRNDPSNPLRRDQFRQYVYPPTPGQEAPEACDAAGWYGEETLDVEAAHGMAPGADILYVGAADCTDVALDKALNRVVSKNLAQIVSNSYGDQGEDVDPAEVTAFQEIAVQAVLQGIGLYFSSGDDGDEPSLPAPSPDFSASSPWVTAVGGTSLGVGRDGRTVVETGWETGKYTLTGGKWVAGEGGPFLYGSGGGTSRLFREPFYQRGIVPDRLARQNQTGSARGRVVPDLSMVGDPNTGMLVGQTQTFPEGVKYGEYRIGGTSLSSPLLAGLVAVADQAAHVRHGFINPVLYQFTSRTGAVRDIRHVDGAVIRVDYVNGLDASEGLTTSARTFDYGDLSIHTRPGYDNVTGLGVPNGRLFLRLL